MTFQILINIIKSNFEAIIALSAFIVAAYQTYSIHKNQKISIKPLLTFKRQIHNTIDTTTLTVYVENNGLGPAIIESFKFYHHNAILNDNHEDIYLYIDSVLVKIHSSIKLISLGSMNKGSVLLPQNKLTLICVSMPKELEKQFDEGLVKFDLMITYKSLYDEKFNLNSQNEYGSG
jgi:hypothetical protein